MSKSQSAGRFHPARVAICLALALASAACAKGQPPRCDFGPATAAARNAVSLTSLVWSPFGRTETGWAIYAPLVAREIGSGCSPASPAFAGALAQWQIRVGLPGSGIMDMATFTQLKRIWQDRRPFVAASHLACPAPPAENSLVRARVTESYGGKAIWLRPAALVAYRAMVASARAHSPAVAADPRLMTIFSAYRSPAYDDARCVRDANCQGVVRASCSAHRTGLAMDLFLGGAPGFGPDSSADANRLAISRGSAYLWLVRNADRFGFVNYPFEPWHWEWVGEKP